MKETYEKIYEKPGAAWTRTELHPELEELISSGRVSPCRAIDIGCGEGFDSVYLASKGFRVTGIDFSERAIQYAKENAEKQGVKVNFQAMDITNPQGLNERFDFALEWGLLHCIDHSKWVSHAEAVSNLLNRGGKYAMMAFNIQSPDFGGPGKRIRTSSVGNSLYFSSLDELRELFEPHFRILESRLIKISRKGGHNSTSQDHIANYLFMERK